MAELHAVQIAAPVEVLRRRQVLLTCILATCARNAEPPLWIYRPPGADAFNQSWNGYAIATGLFNLCLVALVLVAGIIGDLRGRRRIMRIGLGGLIAANLLLLLSPAPSWLILTRVLSGGFGALVVPLALSILYTAYADLPETRTRAIGVYVLVTTAVFLLSGPIGYISYSWFGWRAPIVLPTLFGIIAFARVQSTTPESQAQIEHRSDAFGYTAWALVVLSALGSLISWRGSGRYAALGLALALAGLLAGGWLLRWWSRRAREAILGPTRIKRRALIVLMLFGFAMQFGFVGYVVQVRNTLIQVYAYGSVLSTLALAPLLLGMLLMTIYATRRLTAAAPRRLLAGGILAGGAVCAATALTGATGSYLWLACLLAIFGAAMVLTTITWTALFLTAVPEGVIGVRTGINSAVFQMGGILGNLVPGALLVQYGTASYERLLLAAGAAPNQIEGALAALNTLLTPAHLEGGPPAELAGVLLKAYTLAYIEAYHNVLLVLAAVCAFGAALIWFGLARPMAAAARS